MNNNLNKTTEEIKNKFSNISLDIPNYDSLKPIKDYIQKPKEIKTYLEFVAHNLHEPLKDHPIINFLGGVMDVVFVAPLFLLFLLIYPITFLTLYIFIKYHPLVLVVGPFVLYTIFLKTRKSKDVNIRTIFPTLLLFFIMFVAIEFIRYRLGIMPFFIAFGAFYLIYKSFMSISNKVIRNQIKFSNEMAQLHQQIIELNNNTNPFKDFSKGLPFISKPNNPNKESLESIYKHIEELNKDTKPFESFVKLANMGVTTYLGVKYRFKK